jgi:uncharacterized membrane protein YphA (DoxX/SURF4 family)
MRAAARWETKLQATARLLVAWPAVHTFALLALCSAYLQGGIDKAADFGAAMDEMRNFGLAPAGPFALAVIALELVGSALILTGIWRWAGALALAAFTLIATLLANRFWDAPAANRLAIENGFFEHLGLVGGLILVAWWDLAEPAGAADAVTFHDG